MKIKLPKSVLHEALSTVKETLPIKSTSPVLTYIVFDATEALTITTSNGSDVSVFKPVSTTIESAGRVGVLADLVKIVSQCDEDDISIETLGSGDKIKLTCGTYSAELGSRSGEALDEFPEVPTLSGDSLDIPLTPIFTTYMKICDSSICIDKGRTNLLGLKVEIGKEFIALSSTDSHRLSRAVVPVALEDGFEVHGKDSWIDERKLIQYVVSKESVGILKKKQWTNATIGYDNHLVFNREDLTLYCGLQQNDFLDFSKHLKDLSGPEITAQTKAFKKALNRVSIFSEEDKKSREVSFYVNGNQMKLFSAYGNGKRTDNVPVTFDGELEFAIRSNYLIEYLSSEPEDSVQFKISKNRMIFEKENFVHVVGLING